MFALAKHMHIRPWEIDLLTYEDFEYCVRCLEDYAAAMEKGGGMPDV